MIIAIGNQKGGIGKTTTTQAIGSYYSLKGHKTLLIDLDPQSNLTIATGVNRDNILTTYELLNKDIKVDVKDVIQPIRDNLHIVPASNKLSEISDHLPKIGRYDVLKKVLKPITNEYEIILLDTPPALSDLTLNAFMVSKKIVVPAQADLFSLEAIKELSGTIEAVREYNKELEVAGILLTRYQSRSILTQELTQLIENIAKNLNTRVFKRPIREAIAIKEAQAMHQDIFTYAPKSKVAEDYEAFIKELQAI